MTALATTTETAARREDQAFRLVKSGLVGLPESAPYRRRFETLKQIRRPMEPKWREVRDYIIPFCGRHLNDDGGDPNNESYVIDNSHIRDSMPTKMAITAADGLHGGLTNQSEQWFNLYTGDYESFHDSKSEEAKAWIDNAQECVRDTLAGSNFYTAIHTFYLEALCFGTAAMLVLADPKTRARYYTKTIGSYWLSQDSSGRIDAIYLKISARAIDIVKEYGAENCPQRVLDCFKSSGRQDTRFTIIQCIQPWNYFGRNSRHPEYTFEDVRYVEGGAEDEKILQRSGYRTQPFVAMRWSDSGDYAYGRSCPGLDSLPDVKQLHALTKDYNMAVKWLSDPAWAIPPNFKADAILPGRMYETDQAQMREPLIRALVPPDFDLDANTQARQDLRDRISAFMYNREILLVQSRERQITATEVAQLVQERNAVLGPITARMGSNAHIPILDRTFEIVVDEWRMLPPAPEELQGEEIKPYFTGQLAKAQRQNGVMGDAMQALNFILQVYQVDQEIVRSVDFDFWLRTFETADMLPGGVLKSREAVEEMVAALRQQQQQQQQAAGMAQMAGMAQQLGNASVTPDSALGQMVGGEGMEAATA